MGSNVVYNPETGTYVVKGSTDDTTNGDTSSNPNFGLSAEEINLKSMKAQRAELGIKQVDSKAGETPRSSRSE